MAYWNVVSEEYIQFFPNDFVLNKELFMPTTYYTIRYR